MILSSKESADLLRNLSNPNEENIKKRNCFLNSLEDLQAEIDEDGTVVVEIVDRNKEDS